MVDAGVDAFVPEPDSGPMLASAGERCASNEACSSGECLTEAERADIPGGMCVRGCRLDVPEDCPDGTICYDVGRTLCAETCTATSDCPDGRLCFPSIDGPSTCLPTCWRDDQCESGVCNPWIGFCVTERPTSGGGSWAACTSDSDCRSQSCDTSFGGCVVYCPLDVEGPVCPEAGEVCVDDIGFATVGSCRPTCTVDADCETGRCGMFDGVQACN